MGTTSTIGTSDTASATNMPSDNPTAAPTFKETTASPTDMPTDNPTVAPTVEQTKAPTKKPTGKKQMCCAWGGVCKNKNPKAWCNKSKKNCEGPCNGEYIDPKVPKPKGCCARNGKCNPKNFYCNWSRKNCVNRCKGKWKV